MSCILDIPEHQLAKVGAPRVVAKAPLGQALRHKASRRPTPPRACWWLVARRPTLVRVVGTLRPPYLSREGQGGTGCRDHPASSPARRRVTELAREFCWVMCTTSPLVFHAPLSRCYMDGGGGHPHGNRLGNALGLATGRVRLFSSSVCAVNNALTWRLALVMLLARSNCG